MNRLSIRFFSLLILISHCALASSGAISYCVANDAKHLNAKIKTCFFAAEEIRTNTAYSKLNDFDKGHHKTTIKFLSFPVGKKIEWFVRRLHSPDPLAYQKMGSFIVREDEEIDTGTEIISLFCVSSRGYLPGERVYFRYENSQEKFLEEVSFIPNPAKAQGVEEGFSVSIELLCAAPTSYALFIKGWKENEGVLMRSVSVNETMEQLIKIPASGLCMHFMPGVIGQKGGIADLSFRAKNGKKIQLYLPWGRDLSRYSEIRGNKVGSIGVKESCSVVENNEKHPKGKS